MSKYLVSINGITGLKSPTDFGVERYNLTNMGRLGSGRMVGDLIAKKRKFTFMYEVISGRDLDKLRQAIDTDEMFFDLVYVENKVTYTVTVYAGAMKYRKFRTDGIWYWKNLTFDLIEQ